MLLCVLRAFDGVFYGGASSLHVYSLEMCSKRILGGAAMLMQMSFGQGWPFQGEIFDGDKGWEWSSSQLFFLEKSEEHSRFMCFSIVVF